MEKKVQKDINKSKNYFLHSFDMAHKRRRTTRKGKCSKKNSAPLAVSLKTRKRKDTVTNSQVQKSLDSLLKQRGKILSKSTERRVYRGCSCFYCTSMVTLSRKRSKEDTLLKW